MRPFSKLLPPGNPLSLRLLTALAAAVVLCGCTKKVTESLGGTLQVDMENWAAVVPYGGPGTSQIFSVSVSGGVILPATITSSQNWLGIEQSSSETPLEVNIRTVLFHSSFPGDTLPVGHYSDTVIVTVQGAVGSPYRIPVELTVLPDLRINPTHFYFLSALGVVDSQAQPLTLRSAGGGAVPYSIVSGANWLKASPLSGTLDDTVSISTDNSLVGPGTHISTLEISAAGTFTSLQVVTCTLVVASWVPQETQIKQDIRGIDFVDNQHGCAVGVLIPPPNQKIEGYTMTTSDGGQTWVFAGSITPEPLAAIDFNDGFSGWAVGSNGLVMKTTDGGQIWTQHSLGLTFDLFDVYFADADTGWIVGESGTILRTVSAGVDWLEVPLHPTTNTLSSVHFVDGMVGWTVGDAGTIFSTIDGGENWFQEDPPVRPYLRSVFFRSPTNGWAVGKFGTILHFDGIGWTVQTSGTVNELWDVFFVSDNEGWTMGYGGDVLHTSDGGVTWTKQAIDSDPTSFFFCSKFLDALHGWIGGSRGAIFYTANGGN